MSDVRYTNTLLERFFSAYYHLEKQFFQLTFPDLTITEFHTLEAIADDELTMFQLAFKLNITMGTATTAVQKLLKKDFLIRKKDMEDKRKVLVSLTPQGKEALAFHITFHENILHAILNPMKSEEIQQFNLTMLKLLGGLKEQIREFEPMTLSDVLTSHTYLIHECPSGLSLFKPHDSVFILSKDENEITLMVNDVKVVLKNVLAHSILVIKQFHKESL